MQWMLRLLVSNYVYDPRHRANSYFAATSRGLTPTPEPAYDHKWKCYVCNKLYTAKASVERHFLYTHLKTHYLFQPYRVPKLAYDKTTGKFVKLLNEVPQHPWFTGLCVELRQLIFEQVLSISQHPEQTDDVFRVQALQLPGTLADEAAAALKHSNLFVRITTYYSHAQEGEDDCQLVRNLARNIDAILEPNIADNLDVEPALHLMLDDPSVVEGPKVATSFLFAYNEGTFATLIRNLIAVGDDIGAFSIRFRSLFAAPRQRYAAADIIRYLGYLRLPVSVAISDVMDIIEIRELKRRIESDFSTHQGVIDLLKQLIVDSDDFMQQNEYLRALATLKFAAGVWEDDSVPFTTDPTPSRNAIDELCGRIHLLGCQVINSMTIEATGQGRLETVSFHYLEEAAFDWAAGAFIFSVILELLRGQAHLTRGVAYKHLTRYFKERNEPGDASTAAQYRLEARKDFYFATLVLDGEQGLEARRELIQHDFYDHTETNAEIAGLVSHYPIQYGQVFTGNRRLLETWEGEELDHIVDRRDRPLGWE